MLAYVAHVRLTYKLASLIVLFIKKKNVELNLLFISQANNIGNIEIPVFPSSIPFVHRIIHKFSRVSRKEVTRNVPDVLKLLPILFACEINNKFNSTFFLFDENIQIICLK
jgi:hypothetical protein